MLEGYVYSVGVLLVLILAATHWLDGFFYDHDKIRRRRIKLILVLSCLFLTQGIYLPLVEGIYLNLSSILLPLPLCLYYFWQLPGGQMGHTAAIIIFLAVLYAGSQRLFLLDPILMIIPPLYLYPLLFTLFTFPVTSDVHRRWLMVSFGMIGGELTSKLFILGQSGLVWVGEASFRDQLFLALAAVTCAALGWEYMHKIGRQIVHCAIWRSLFGPLDSKRRA